VVVEGEKRDASGEAPDDHVGEVVDGDGVLVDQDEGEVRGQVFDLLRPAGNVRKVDIELGTGPQRVVLLAGQQQKQSHRLAAPVQKVHHAQQKPVHEVHLGPAGVPRVGRRLGHSSRPSSTAAVRIFRTGSPASDVLTPNSSTFRSCCAGTPNYSDIPNVLK